MWMKYLIKIIFPLRKTFSEYAGEYYSPFKIKKILEEIDVLIENNDLQFVEHSVSEEIENYNVNIVFNIFEGKKKQSKGLILLVTISPMKTLLEEN